ncbi:MAG: hypothetical protein GXO99_05455 [Nitrospirae bacterium]|nr:hypothetical protein [Nitrospirota bacterium]
MNRFELKKVVIEALKNRDLEKIARLALEHPRTISILFSLSYDKDSLITWRAIEAMGEVVKEIARRSREDAREIMKRLLWSITEESGGLGWSSIEMISEVIVKSPEVFSDVALLIPEYFDEPVFRESVLYAIWRIGKERPELLERDAVKEVLSEALKSEDPEIQGLALLILKDCGGNLGLEGIDRSGIKVKQNNQIRIYNNGNFKYLTFNEIL